ncbi:MAG: hypothetical protein MJ146_03125 [Clostridia bacterium]|nr:hypothetical protein [Clostridia bacterium]
MDIFEIIKKVIQKLKLISFYFRRIIFVRNHFKASFFTKVRANLGGGFLADQWILYDLNGKKKKEYLSEFDWYRSRYINDPFDFMLNNKIVATEVLKKYIRVPEIYIVNSKGIISDFEGNLLSNEDVVNCVREKKSAFIKPYGKGKGNGVNHFSFDGKDFFIDDEMVSEDALLKHLKKRKDWYLSETIKQHEYANKLYDKTVNTIRMITYRNPSTKKLEVFFAVQRIGTEKTIPVDNGSRGGLVCKIDLDTGRLSHGRCLHDKVVYDVHPDSGYRFEDMVIPDWEEMKAEVLSLAEKFPYMHFIAWDVMKTDNGDNCIIEGNTSSGVNIIQLWGGQRNGKLGDFYRAHGVIKK